MDNNTLATGIKLALLDLLEISKSYESQKILGGVDFFVNKGDRICIIGKNGGGKSTLMKIINGTLEADSGRRIVQNLLKVGMLDQSPSFDEGLSVKGAIKNELKELKDAKDEYEEVLKKLTNDFGNKKLLKKQDEWNAPYKLDKL